MEKELTYMLEISVNTVLSETEKSRLMIALSKAVETVLGPSKSGFVLIHSVPIQHATEETLALARIQHKDEENELEILKTKL